MLIYHSDNKDLKISKKINKKIHNKKLKIFHLKYQNQFNQFNKINKKNHNQPKLNLNLLNKKLNHQKLPLKLHQKLQNLNKTIQILMNKT